MKKLMEDYNLSNQTVRNFKTRKVDHSRLSGFCDYNIKIEVVYEIEDKLDENQKLQIINYHTDGLGSYILNLIEKYWEARDKKEIKEISYGNLNMNSLKAWIKKNDERNVLKTWYNEHYPTYYMFHNEFRLDRDLKTPRTSYSYKMLYDGSSVINQWFHDMLKDLEDQERKYFVENDPIQIKIKEINDLYNETILGILKFFIKSLIHFLPLMRSSSITL